MVLGIMLSVSILSAGLHLFQGYESTLKKLLLDSFAHVGISSSTGALLSQDQVSTACGLISAQDDVMSCVPSLNFQLMAQSGDKLRAASLRAYAPAQNHSYAKYIKAGRADIGIKEVIVGHYLLQELGLALGDSISLNYPRLDQITPLGIPSATDKYQVAGIYRSGYYENDRGIVICSLPDARALMMVPDGFSKIEVHLKDAEKAGIRAAQYVESLGFDYVAIPWNYYAESLLRLVAMEKWLIFIVFSFLVLIAGINVISTVTTIIIDQKAEIAVLKTLGASSRCIRRLLIYRVGIVGILSVFAGQIFGVLLSWFVEKQSFYRLKGDVYFIDTLGAQITLPNLLIVFLVSGMLVFICILIPLKQIEKLQIIEIIRNQH